MSKYLSRADLERIGGTVVNQYYQTVPRVGTMPAPVDPVALAKVVLGLEISYLPLSVDGSILGVACFQEMELEVCGEDGEPYQVQLTGRDIVIDNSLLDADKTGRHNFTAAHELAHHVLVRLYPEDYRNSLNRRMRIMYRDAKQARDWEEWQANVMAAAIIMPAKTLRGCMSMFGLEKQPDRASPASKAKDFERFCDIATYLGVSRKALAIRMKRLGLLDEKILSSPVVPGDGRKDKIDD